ncbi:MAG: hypothetical protein ABL997_16970 [Planctomycetota bacterium]
MRTNLRTAAAIALHAALLSSALLPAQTKTQEQLIELRTQKLGKDVFKKAEWILDYDAARATAVATDKPIFAYFTRSYAH